MPSGDVFRTGIWIYTAIHDAGGKGIPVSSGSDKENIQEHDAVGVHGKDRSSV